MNRLRYLLVAVLSVLAVLSSQRSAGRDPLIRTARAAGSNYATCAPSLFGVEGFGSTWRVHVINRDTGAMTLHSTWPGTLDLSLADFAPDGTLYAIQTIGGVQRLAIVDLDRQTVEPLDYLPAGLPIRDIAFTPATDASPLGYIVRADSSGPRVLGAGVKLYAIDSLHPLSLHEVPIQTSGPHPTNVGLGLGVAPDGATVYYTTTDTTFAASTAGPTPLTFQVIDLVKLLDLETDASVAGPAAGDVAPDPILSIADSVVLWRADPLNSIYSPLVMPAQIVSLVYRECPFGGIRLTPPQAGLRTTEDGGAAEFTAVLTSAPTANVTVTFASSDATEGTVTSAPLVFTSANWFTPQAVTVTGVADAVTDGVQSYTVTTSSVVSTDPAYSDRAVGQVSLVNLDTTTDTDGDSVMDAFDNCYLTPNALQTDTDGDGRGDACDNCVTRVNPGQENVDADAAGDLCEVDPAATLSPARLSAGVSGAPYGPVAFSAAPGAAGPYTYSVVGTLPPGLTLSSAGVLSGTPTALGIYPFSVEASEAAFGKTGSTDYSIAVGSPIAAGDLVISEFRFRGAVSGDDGSRNEYVEIHNRKSTDLVVGEAITLATDSGAVVGVIPPGTTIPAHGFHLFTNHHNPSGSGPAGFWLGALASYPNFFGTVGLGDLPFLVADIPDGAGIALFRGITLNSSSRLDSVGFASVTDPLYFEGTRLTPSGGITVDGEYAFVRKYTNSAGGALVDTGNNAQDFVFVAPDAGTYSGRVAALGAPGPEGNGSHFDWTNALLTMDLVWPPTGGNGLYNRATVAAGGGDPAALEFRRRFTNHTGQALSQIRFKVTALTTLNGPVLYPVQSDLRPVESDLVVLDLPTGPDSNALALRLSLESQYQNFGTTKPEGGLNSTLRLTGGLPGGTLTNGDFVDVNFKVFIHKGGSFTLWVVPQARP